VLLCGVVCCGMLQCCVVCCGVLQYCVVWCIVEFCVAVRSMVLRCAAVLFGVLWCVMVCCVCRVIQLLTGTCSCNWSEITELLLKAVHIVVHEGIWNRS
jgi:hypothetical protein